jgi:uncharacterized membrane protein
MTDDPTRVYDKRMAELERRMGALEAAVLLARSRATAAQPAAAATPAEGEPLMTSTQQSAWPSSYQSEPDPSYESSQSPRSAWSGDEWFSRGEGWLGRSGVALVVIGLIFLFRYIGDRGWITPELRVLAGLLLGSAMLEVGLRHLHGRDRYRQILMGGGVVILFVTGLAASELYQIVPGAVTLAFHATVAMVAFTIASRRRDAVMASIGAAGAMLPPGLLLADSVAGPLLWLYLVLVASWAALLASRYEPGPFPVIAVVSALIAAFQPVSSDTTTRIAAVAAMIAIWIGYAALPLLRARLTEAMPLPEGTAGSMFTRLLQPLFVTILLAISLHYELPSRAGTFEIAAAVAAAGFALIALWLWRRRALQPSEAEGWQAQLLETDDFAAAAMAVVACVTISLGSLVGYDARALPIAALAGAAFIAAPRLGAPALKVLAHIMFAWVGIEFMIGIPEFIARPAFDPLALSFAAAAVLAVVIVQRAPTSSERLVYAVCIFIVAHVLLATELGGVRGAAWLASASYAIVGSALVLIGLTRGSMLLQRAGLVSLALLVIRLFVYDLATADVRVRIALFLATGFAFLGLSYLFKGRRGSEAGETLESQL